MSALEVIHCDNHVLVVAKPACLPTVLDDSGDESLHMQAKRWIAVEFSKPGNVYLGVVHRLDRPVSGLVCFARTSKAAERLSKALQAGRFEKRYVAVGESRDGSPRAESGELVQWLEKDRARNVVRAHAREIEGAKRAVTRWRVVRRFEAERGIRTVFEFEPLTGRSHQLRVAARTLGSPLLGDLKYGAPTALPDKSVALHARALAFEHPTTKARLEFELEPPTRDWWPAR